MSARLAVDGIVDKPGLRLLVRTLWALDKDRCELRGPWLPEDRQGYRNLTPGLLRQLVLRCTMERRHLKAGWVCGGRRILRDDTPPGPGRLLAALGTWYVLHVPSPQGRQALPGPVRRVSRESGVRRESSLQAGAPVPAPPSPRPATSPDR